MQKLGKLFETHDPRLVLIFHIQGNWKSKMSDKSCIKLPGVFNPTIFLWNQQYLHCIPNAILDLLGFPNRCLQYHIRHFSECSSNLPVSNFRFMSATFRCLKNQSFGKVKNVQIFSMCTWNARTLTPETD